MLDPLAAGEPSAGAKRKKATRRAPDGPPQHVFRTLLGDLENVTRSLICSKGQTGTRQCEFEIDSQLSAGHDRALELPKGTRI